MKLWAAVLLVSETMSWAGSRHTRGKVTVRGTANSLNYCIIRLVCTQFTNLAAGRVLETHAVC
jgi:hypothetical protein